MKYVNVKYRKNNGQFKSHQPLNHIVGVIFLIVLALLLALSYYKQENERPLISPLADGVMPVYAKEPEVVISCDNPRGYLECLAYQKVISWDQYRIMEAIAEAESHFNENAIHLNEDSIDRGIFQINSKFHKKLTNVEAFQFKRNIDYAIKVMKSSGYTQWAAYKNGSYKQYLDK